MLHQDRDVRDQVERRLARLEAEVGIRVTERDEPDTDDIERRLARLQAIVDLRQGRA